MSRQASQYFGLTEESMRKTVEAIYEHGVFKPLCALDLKEQEREIITIEKTKGVSRASSGIIKGLDDDMIDEITLSARFLPDEDD